MKKRVLLGVLIGTMIMGCATFMACQKEPANQATNNTTSTDTPTASNQFEGKKFTYKAEEKDSDMSQTITVQFKTATSGSISLEIKIGKTKTSYGPYSFDYSADGTTVTVMMTEDVEMLNFETGEMEVALTEGEELEGKLIGSTFKFMDIVFK